MVQHETRDGWYCVRTVFRFHFGEQTTFEERLTLWQAADFATAITTEDYLTAFFDTGSERQQS